MPKAPPPPRHTCHHARSSVVPQEWLVATGNLRQVLDLVSAAEKPKGGADQTPPSKTAQR